MSEKMCKEAREKARLTIKEVALQLKTPQFRIKDIEEVSVDKIVPDILIRYIDLLGLRRWYSKWSRANKTLASRLAKRLPAKRGVSST